MRRVGTVQHRQRLQLSRVSHRMPPRDESAPIVSDDRHLGCAQRVDERRDIVRESFDLVCVDALGFVTPAVAAKIGGHDAIAGSSERSDLVAPRVPELGKPVEQHHDGRVVSRGLVLDVVEPDPLRVGVAVNDELVDGFGHASLSCCPAA